MNGTEVPAKTKLTYEPGEQNLPLLKLNWRYQSMLAMKTSIFHSTKIIFFLKMQYHHKYFAPLCAGKRYHYD